MLHGKVLEVFASRLPGGLVRRAVLRYFQPFDVRKIGAPAERELAQPSSVSPWPSLRQTCSRGAHRRRPAPPHGRRCDP
jgi:hypothetical protein